MHHLFFFSFFFVANLCQLFYVDALTEIPKEHQMMIDQHPYRVLGIGHACMDLLIPVEEDFLQYIPGEKGGAQPIEYEQLKQILKISQKPHLATGGSCANTIKGLAGLGEKCAFLSHVGSDPLGEHFVNYMNKLGIVGLFTQSKKPTAQVLCLITPDGQRTMRFYAGCSEEMSDYFLHSDYFKNVSLMHLDAYSLRNDHLVKSVMHLAKNANVPISIDLSSFEIVRQFREQLTYLLPTYVNIVFANEDEIKTMTGLGAYEGCLKLQEMCPIAVVLIGSQGCLVGHKGEVFHSPGFPAHLVDSTGAGDLFASGFLYGYLQGYPLSKCAKIGNRLGSAIVEVQGAELPAEKLKNIQSFLLEN